MLESVLLAHVNVYHIGAGRRSGEGIRFSETGVTDSCELPWGAGNRSSAKAASALNCSTISPDPYKKLTLSYKIVFLLCFPLKKKAK